MDTNLVSQQIQCPQQDVFTNGTDSRPQNRQCSPFIFFASILLYIIALYRPDVFSQVYEKTILSHITRIIMGTASKIKISREKWRQKSIDRGAQVRYLRKENNRIRCQRDSYKKDVQQLNQRLIKDQKTKAVSPIGNKTTLIYVALQLFLVARISFRGVSRVLSVLSKMLGISKVPCHQTIINWLQRLTLVKMQSIPPIQPITIPQGSFSNGFVWMLDISIGLGIGEILTVLALDVHHYKKASTAPKLQDLHCVGVCVAPSWTGEKVAIFLSKIIATLGRPAAYLKDGGTDLNKSVRLLTEQGRSSLCIDDVSHKIANLVKHEYQNHPLFATFISACGKVSKNLKQTLLACLAPPKVSVKARFMNLHRLVSWASKILAHSPKGRAEEGSLLLKLRNSLDALPKCRRFIERFLRDVTPLMKCQKIIKNKGLNHETYALCKTLIEPIPVSSSIRIGFNQWAEEQLSIAKKLEVDKTGLVISSDQIESLFGVGKHHGTGEIKDANRIAMRLPALCGTLTMGDAEKVLGVTVKQQQEIMATNTIMKQRQKVLSQPGKLEILSECQEQDYFELIPQSKKRSKTGDKSSNINMLSDLNGPQLKELEARGSSP